ncbi:MAG: hypothetical protein ACD_29C00393G0001 [uncultured bacterium]|nr:MAG: hypothetical protein ACD_29C00393G0001 [uncultured bacterium]
MLNLISVENNEQGACLFLRGDWIISDVDHIELLIEKLITPLSELKIIDATQIVRMDTAGAFIFQVIRQKLLLKFPTVELIGLSANCESLVQLVSNETKKAQSIKTENKNNSVLYELGKKIVEISINACLFFAFLGEVFVTVVSRIKKPLQLQWSAMIHEIDLAGYQALPIIAVMMFLIGIVLAYQLGVQLETYGANIYIVELSGIAILREFSPLICSVIIAGRTSTSFAALIGTMKVNEEIDVLRTMGLSPIERLVIPKIIAMIIALPLLVVWGNIFGVFGSMIMAKSMLGISYKAFLIRLKQEVALKQLVLGVVKAPVFALIIAGVGCFQGFQAESNAESVGKRTTKAAVQSIFLIIFADAMFSILFNWMNW